MILAFALLLTVVQDPQDLPVEPVPALPEPPHVCSAWEVGLGGGLWWLGSFQASTPVGRREISGELLVEADLELSFSSHEWILAARIIRAGTDETDVLLAGLELRTPPLADVSPFEGFPLGLTAAAGVLGGTYEVDEDGFGDFDAGFGGQARLAIETSRRDSVRVVLWVGVRVLQFDYDETVISGDEAIGGASIALGFSGVLRF